MKSFYLYIFTLLLCSNLTAQKTAEYQLGKHAIYSMKDGIFVVGGQLKSRKKLSFYFYDRSLTLVKTGTFVIPHKIEMVAVKKLKGGKVKIAAYPVKPKSTEIFLDEEFNVIEQVHHTSYTPEHLASLQASRNARKRGGMDLYSSMKTLSKRAEKEVLKSDQIILGKELITLGQYGTKQLEKAEGSISKGLHVAVYDTASGGLVKERYHPMSQLDPWFKPEGTGKKARADFHLIEMCKVPNGYKALVILSSTDEVSSASGSKFLPNPRMLTLLEFNNNLDLTVLAKSELKKKQVKLLEKSLIKGGYSVDYKVLTASKDTANGAFSNALSDGPVVIHEKPSLGGYQFSKYEFRVKDNELFFGEISDYFKVKKSDKKELGYHIRDKKSYFRFLLNGKKTIEVSVVQLNE